MRCTDAPRVRVMDDRALPCLVQGAHVKFPLLGRPSFGLPLCFSGKASHDDSQPVGAQEPQPEDLQERFAGPAEQPAAPWRLHALSHKHITEPTRLRRSSYAV